MCRFQPLRSRLFSLDLSLAVAAGGCGGGSGSDVAATKETPEFAKKLQETMKNRAAAQKAVMKKRR
jgi:hypothetical protein